MGSRPKVAGIAAGGIGGLDTMANGSAVDVIVKAFGKFLSRDLMFIIGGSSLLLCVVLAFDTTLAFTDVVKFLKHEVLCVWVIGVSYVIGYAAQECLSLIPFVTTNDVEPIQFLQKLYGRYTGQNYESREHLDFRLARIRLLKLHPDRVLSELERTISLKQIGSAVGSSWLLGAIALAVAAYRSREHAPLSVPVFRATAVIMFLVSLSLIAMSWMKNMQQKLLMCALLGPSDSDLFSNRTKHAFLCTLIGKSFPWFVALRSRLCNALCRNKK